ncbi:MAG: hypothetical protein WA872_22270 [Candidatus Sulfotelmatobacter sp.]
MLLLALPRASAQEDPDDMPLGDVARSLRKNAAPSETVIDNDNFWQVIDDAESRREAGTSLVFSLDSGAKNFNVSSPDVTCSLSFTAKTASLLSDPAVLNELPRTELAKLDGPATIDGDSLQVSMHNGTSWELREVVIGLTIVRRPEPGDPVSYLGPAGVVPSVVGNASPPVQASFQKQPDTTVLLRMKGSAAPSSTATFRTPLNFALFPDQEWHWAIVKAKGIPPQAPPDATAMMQPANADQPAVARPDVNNNSVAPTQSTTNNVPATPDAFPH